MAPPEQQDEGYYRTDTTSDSNDRRRGNHLRGGPGRHEGQPLADDHPHAGDPEGLSPPFVRHFHDEGRLAAIW